MTMRSCNSRIPEEHFVCYATSQRNWVILKVLYRYLQWCLLSWHISRLGFVTPCFGETKYQTESKQNETFGNAIFSSDKTKETRTLRQESHKAITRVEGAPQGAPPASWAPRSSTDVLLPPIYIHVPPNDRGWSQKRNSTAATFCIHEIPSWGLFWCSAGGGIDHGGLLHQHHSPSDEV